MSLADHPDVIRAFCSFVGIKTYGWLCHLRLIEDDTRDMPKQRKMGHITVVGPSLGIVEAQVKSFLKKGRMVTSCRGLFGDDESPIYLSYSIQERDMFHGQKSKTAEEDIGEGIMMNCKRLDQFEGKHGSLAGVKTRAESAINDIAAYFYACSDSLLLTPLCCDDIHEVTLRVSALAGCDRLVSEPLVIEK
ncbi:hypothetical protein Tco_0967494 [Tanacetum coccineum]